MSTRMPTQDRGIIQERADEQAPRFPALPPAPETPEAVRAAMLNHLHVAQQHEPQSQQSKLHSQAAAAYLRRLTAIASGGPEALSANAEFHAFSAFKAESHAEQQSSWQNAWQALNELRRQFPNSPLVAETLVYLAHNAYQQASRGTNGSGT